MKPFLFSVFFTLSLFQQSFGQNKTREEQQFLDLETQWMNAWKNKDEAAVRKIMSDDFALTSVLSTGELTYKETWISHAMHGFDCQSFGFDSIKVRTYSNVAVLNIWYHQTATINGKDWNGNSMLTDVWVKKDENWQVVARHASPWPKK